MRAEIPVERIEYGELQGIDNAADGVYDASRQKPPERRVRKRIPERAEYQQAQPPHGYINNGRKPLRAVYPYHIYEHAYERDAPHKRKQRISKPAAEHYKAHGSVRARYQHKNHHMVKLLEHAERVPRHVYRVVERACAVQ